MWFSGGQADLSPTPYCFPPKSRRIWEEEYRGRERSGGCSGEQLCTSSQGFAFPFGHSLVIPPKELLFGPSSKALYFQQGSLYLRSLF